MECILDVEDIRALLPHRYPMLLVDGVTELIPGHYVLGFKNVTINEPFFNGHFPGQAVMPGVLILESMAQVAGIMVLCMPENAGKLALLCAFEDVRFRRPVLPGDTIVTEARREWLKKDYGKVNLVARVNGKEVASCACKFAFKEPVAVDKDLVYNKIRAAAEAHNAADAQAEVESNGESGTVNAAGSGEANSVGRGA